MPPAEKVWPWLVQMGQGRGGLYTYEWIENLLGAKIDNPHGGKPVARLLDPHGEWVGNVVAIPAGEAAEPARGAGRR